MGRSEKHQNVLIVKTANALAMTSVIAGLPAVGLRLRGPSHENCNVLPGECWSTGISKACKRQTRCSVDAYQLQSLRCMALRDLDGNAGLCDALMQAQATANENRLVDLSAHDSTWLQLIGRSSIGKGGSGVLS